MCVDVWMRRNLSRPTECGAAQLEICGLASFLSCLALPCLSWCVCVCGRIPNREAKSRYTNKYSKLGQRTRQSLSPSPFICMYVCMYARGIYLLVLAPSSVHIDTHTYAPLQPYRLCLLEEKPRLKRELLYACVCAYSAKGKRRKDL